MSISAAPDAEWQRRLVASHSAVIYRPTKHISDWSKWEVIMLVITQQVFTGLFFLLIRTPLWQAVAHELQVIPRRANRRAALAELEPGMSAITSSTYFLPPTALLA